MALAYRRCQDGDLGFEKLQAAQSMQNLEVFSDANFVPVRMREGFAGCVVALESQAQPYHRLRSSPTTQHAKQPNRPVVCLRSWGFQAHVWGAGIAVVANDCGPWLSPPPQGGNRLGRQFQLAEFHNKELQTILAVVGSLLCCVGP